MESKEMTAKILDAKRSKGLTWARLSAEVGLADTYLASCAHGENSLSREAADVFCRMLGLDAEVASQLTQFPVKGQSLAQTVPTDPLVYRFYEIMQVYGLSLKEVIQEKFGHGIMSAIDFTLEVTKQADPKGDRVVVTMNGKFLPYKSW